jgi:hypothetical protein
MADTELSFSHDPFTVTTSPTQHDLCGTISYEATFDGAAITSDSSPVAYSGQDLAFTIWSEDVSFIGTHAITVRAFLTEYPSVENEVTGAIEVVDRCATIDSVTAPAQTDPEEYIYTGEVLSYTIEPFVAEPSGCGSIVYTCEVVSGSRTDLCEVSDGDTVVSFNSNTGTFEFKSTDKANF